MANMANVDIPKSALVSKCDYAPAVAIFTLKGDIMGALRGRSSKKNDASKWKLTLIIILPWNK